jgi:acetyl-CoA carboxylase biotin carboxyl carrier protein
MLESRLVAGPAPSGSKSERRTFDESSREGRKEEMAVEVEAQIAGSLWKIERAVGDAVVEDDVLMIIESMKMEIPVEAPCDGIIAKICVAEGDSIEEGAVLAVIE